MINVKVDLRCFKFFHFAFFISCSLFSCSISRQISKQANNILLNDTAFQHGFIGISIYEPATSKYWYEHDAEKYFIPASNTKLFTLYAGMKYLGDSLVAARYFEEANQLYIVPTGDPTFLHPEFKTQRLLNLLTKKSYTNICLNWGRDIWKEEIYGKGWAWDDYTENYSAPRSPFPMYGNIVRFEVKSDSLLVLNNSTKFPIESSPPYFKNKLTTETLGYPHIYRNIKIQRALGENKFVITNSNKTQVIQEIPFYVDAAIILQLLNDTIKSANSYNSACIFEGSLPIKPEKSRKINTIHSQPSDSLFKPMMYNSDNFFAEQTLLMASNEHLGFMSDDAIIDTLLKTDLKDIPQQPRWVDGSGLSRYNLFTPKSFVYILNKIKNEFGWNRIKNILPPGGSGSLKNYYNSTVPYIYAKTGSMSNNCALSGYLITKKNKFLIFSILVNHYQSGATPVRKAVENFINYIRETF